MIYLSALVGTFWGSAVFIATDSAVIGGVVAVTLVILLMAVMPRCPG